MRFLQRDRVPEANTATIHPRLSGGRGDYYKECAHLRRRLSELLKERLSCPHQLVVVPNTTLGLFVVLLFAVARDWVPVGLYGGTYEPYNGWLRRVLGPKLVQSNQPHLAALMTHVCPTTGAIHDLRAADPRAARIVDAAQSLGTALNRDLFESSSAFAAPLHKNLGVATGLGLLGVNWRSIPPAHHEALREHLRLAEHGTMSRSELEHAVQTTELLTTEDLTNEVRIEIDPRITSVADKLNLEVLTPRGLQAHIVSFTGKSTRKVTDELDVTTLGGKYEERTDILRLSFHSQRLPDEARGKPIEEVVAGMLLQAKR